MNFSSSSKKLMFWSAYFSLVLTLHIFHSINALAVWNLLLFIFVFFPLGEKISDKKIWPVLKNAVSFILALVLLWQESFLPPLNVFFDFFTNDSMQASPRFIWNFFLSIFSLKLFLVLFSIIIFSYLISFTYFKKYLFIYFLIFLCIVGFTEEKKVSGNWLENFYSQESSKQLDFVNNEANDYDLVFLQLCSFAWDDFDYAKHNMEPFFKQFDFVFTNFNSATSYSNLAVLRFLRSSCGQSSQAALFTDVNPKCYLMDNLRNIGYKTYTGINHDGAYSGFQDAVVKYGHADPPLDKSSLTFIEKGFDDTPVYSDYESLNLWSQAREKNNQKSALFYNSITLHTGSYYINNESLTGLKHYDLALSNVVSDLNKFFSDLKKSNRKTIVVILGEHGSALRGSSIQLATVREIPLPKLTNVPAAIKIFGPGFNDEPESSPVYIKKKTSHFALTELLSRIIAEAPATYNSLNREELVSNLTETDLVSENETGVVLQEESGLYYRFTNQKKWNRLLGSF